MDLQDAVVSVICSGFPMQEVLDMDYLRFLSLKKSVDRNEALRGIQSIMCGVASQSDKAFKLQVDSYKKILDGNEGNNDVQELLKYQR